MKMLSAILLACVMALCLPTKASATELRLHFKAPDQSKVSIEKAEIILTGWGWIETVALTPEGDTVRLNFESLAAQSPEKF